MVDEIEHYHRVRILTYINLILKDKPLDTTASSFNRFTRSKNKVQFAMIHKMEHCHGVENNLVDISFCLKDKLLDTFTWIKNYSEQNLSLSIKLNIAM